MPESASPARAWCGIRFCGSPGEPTLIGNADRARAKPAFNAMMQMKRIDIAALERAAGGGTASSA